MNEIYEEIYNKHYIRVDENSSIIKGFSDAFTQPKEGDICINERGGYQFRLYPNGEENPPLRNDYGILMYKWNGSEAVRRTEEELQPELTEILKQEKLTHLNTACQSTIYAGIDVETSVGTKHFNMSEHDQINLSGYSNAITAALAGLPSQVDLDKGVWYKADSEGESHRYWSVEDFQKIISEAFAFKVEQLTYLDELKIYVRGLQSADQVNAVYYGMTI